MPSLRDLDLEDWLDRQSVQAPEPTPAELEAEEQWIQGVLAKLEREEAPAAPEAAPKAAEDKAA